MDEVYMKLDKLSEGHVADEELSAEEQAKKDAAKEHADKAAEAANKKDGVVHIDAASEAAKEKEGGGAGEAAK